MGCFGGASATSTYRMAVQVFGDCSGPSHDAHYIKPGEVAIEGELLK